MNPAQQELFDDAILRVLDGNRTRFGLGAEAIGHLIAQYGFQSPAKDAVLDRLDYLSRKQLAEEVDKPDHRANRAWRITDVGIDRLDTRG
jgi:hypothetical protein